MDSDALPDLLPVLYPVNSSTLPTLLNETHFNYSFLDVDSFLTLYLGPKHLPHNVVIPITIVYAIIFISGVVGNVSVCVVIIRNSAMHTATNYYLFSLAVSDLTILLLGLPNDLSLYWQQYPWMFGEIVCKLRALVAETTSYASVLTIVCFSLERYLAICHPLHAYTMSGLSRVILIITLIWIIALISAIPFAVFTGINYVEFPPGSGLLARESAFCAMFDENKPKQWPLYEMATFIFFVVPMSILCFLYVRMGIQIRRSAVRRSEIHRDGKQSSSRKTALTMLVAVVIGFFVCWAPFHAQRLLYVYAQDSPDFRAINEKMYYITGCFYYFSATINPILYNVMSARYREAFRETLCWGSANRLSRSKQMTTSDRFSTVSRSSYAAPTWTRPNSNRSLRGSPLIRNPEFAGPSCRRLSFHDSVRESVYLLKENDNSKCVATGKERRTKSTRTLREPRNSNWRSTSTYKARSADGWRSSSIRAGCTPSCVKSSQITRNLSEMANTAEIVHELWTTASTAAEGGRISNNLTKETRI